MADHSKEFHHKNLQWSEKDLIERKTNSERIWIGIFVLTFIGIISYLLIMFLFQSDISNHLFCIILSAPILIGEYSIILNSKKWRIAIYQNSVRFPAMKTNNPESINENTFRTNPIESVFFEFNQIWKIEPIHYENNLDSDCIGLKIISKKNEKDWYVTFIPGSSQIRISVLIYLINKQQRLDTKRSSDKPADINIDGQITNLKRIPYELKMLDSMEYDKIQKSIVQSKGKLIYSDSLRKYSRIIRFELLKNFSLEIFFLGLGTILLMKSNSLIFDFLKDPLGYFDNNSIIIIALPTVGVFSLAFGVAGLFLLETIRYGPYKLYENGIAIPYISLPFLANFPEILFIKRYYQFNEIAGIIIEQQFIFVYIKNKDRTISVTRIPKSHFLDFSASIKQIERGNIHVYYLQ